MEMRWPSPPWCTASPVPPAKPRNYTAFILANGGAIVENPPKLMIIPSSLAKFRSLSKKWFAVWVMQLASCQTAFTDDDNKIAREQALNESLLTGLCQALPFEVLAAYLMEHWLDFWALEGATHKNVELPLVVLFENGTNWDHLQQFSTHANQ